MTSVESTVRVYRSAVLLSVQSLVTSVQSTVRVYRSAVLLSVQSLVTSVESYYQSLQVCRSSQCSVFGDLCGVLLSESTGLLFFSVFSLW